jgi:hypothetical protein
MLEVSEQDIDRISELFYRILKGEIPQPLALPKDSPDNEVKQAVEYANRFVADYQALAGAMTAMSCGDLKPTVIVLWPLHVAKIIYLAPKILATNFSIKSAK